MDERAEPNTPTEQNTALGRIPHGAERKHCHARDLFGLLHRCFAGRGRACGRVGELWGRGRGVWLVVHGVGEGEELQGAP